jgi:predicted metal-dependent HD superfamily phosphohydrolase
MDKHHLYLLAEAESAATTIFSEQVKPLFAFHNIEHTRRVVRAAGEIMTDYELEESDRFTILLSAWFHDTGFNAGYIENHETQSIKIATDFLAQYQESNDVISRVTACIAATRMPQKPLTIPEMIICDADLFHLGTNDFPPMTELLRLEFQEYFGKIFPKEDWDNHNIDFLTRHRYFTTYCQTKLEPGKVEWIKVLRQQRPG